MHDITLYECSILLAFNKGISVPLIIMVLLLGILSIIAIVYLITRVHFQNKTICERDDQIKHKEKEIEHLSNEINLRTENLEKALIKAEESNHLKSLFLANMSHEIRTPLNSIMGFSELITEEGHDVNSRSLFARQINQNSQNLLKLIDQIFHLSIIETGKTRIHKTEFKVNETLEPIITDIRSKINETKKNINLIVNMEDPVYFINTDRDKFILIIENLFDNALKFTDHGMIEFTYIRMETEYLFRISDSGCGIREDECELIFDPFTQGTEAIKKIKGGSGLGLSNVKNYVILLGGKIWCEMNKPSGTIFCFTIPADPLNTFELQNLINFSLIQN